MCGFVFPRSSELLFTFGRPWTRGDMFSWTDASAHGWGALLEPLRMGAGQWPPLECRLYVNALELRAIRRAVSFFDLRRLVLRVFTDETVQFTLAACRTHSFALRRKLVSLLTDLQDHALHFQVLRVPTALNVVADALSRVDSLNTEWTLTHSAFEDVLRWAGPFEVDLMASPVNYRLSKWVSAFPHPGSLAVDCRSFDWAAFGSLYLFPPPAMITSSSPVRSPSW